MDWHKNVKEYLDCYEEDTHDNQVEYIDNLVPIYNSEIQKEALRLWIITSCIIEKKHAGLSLIEVLQDCIRSVYWEEFYEAYNEYVLTCEKCGDEYSLEMGECDNCDEEE